MALQVHTGDRNRELKVIQTSVIQMVCTNVSLYILLPYYLEPFQFLRRFVDFVHGHILRLRCVFIVLIDCHEALLSLK